MMKYLSAIIALFSIAGCSSTGIPEGISPVKPFDLERYLGKWYEIARIDNRFEKGMNQVTADYSLKKDGTVRVLNRGYLTEKGVWKTAEGRAAFVGNSDTGHLKVSFFGPFYASYIVFELDQENYQYAYVTGNSRDYLWFLSRTPKVSEPMVDNFLSKAKALGFDTDKVILVSQKSIEQ